MIFAKCKSGCLGLLLKTPQQPPLALRIKGQLTEKLLSVRKTTWVWLSSFSTLVLTQCHYRSGISGENLASKLRYAMSVKIHTGH